MTSNRPRYCDRCIKSSQIASTSIDPKHHMSFPTHTIPCPLSCQVNCVTNSMCLLQRVLHTWPMTSMLTLTAAQDTFHCNPPSTCSILSSLGSPRYIYILLSQIRFRKTLICLEGIQILELPGDMQPHEIKSLPK